MFGNGGIIGADGYGNGAAYNTRVLDMGDVRNYLATRDPYFNNVTLLHQKGQDYSKNHTTFTSVGTGALANTARYKVGTSSIYLPGTSYFHKTPDAGIGNFSGDFTIECWINMSTSAVAGRGIMSTGTSALTTNWQLELTATNTLSFLYAGATAVNGVTALLGNTWYHVAVSRSGTTINLYLNGVLEDTKSSSASYTDTTRFAIGTSRTTAAYFTGWIDAVRITKDVARYTSNFTPSTLSFPTY